MAIMYRLLFKQIYNTFRRQGFIATCGYLMKSFNHLTIDRYLHGSFSQKGEDLIIDKYFKHKKKGFYIDVGSFHPQMNSNTKFFYDRGWHGINIEPNPTRIKLFLQERKRDRNLNIGIGTTTKRALFYEFEAKGLSTFSKEEADSLLKIGYKLRKKNRIQMYQLREIMEKHVKSAVDFITIDAEGSDLDVLKSNDWGKYRPKLLCVETLDFIDLLTSTKENSHEKDMITDYLFKKSYKEYFSNGLNTLYIDTKQTG